jgi:hypothetical protein
VPIRTPIELSATGRSAQSFAAMERETIYPLIDGPGFPRIPVADLWVASKGSTGGTTAGGLSSEYGLNPRAQRLLHRRWSRSGCPRCAADRRAQRLSHL